MLPLPDELLPLHVVADHWSREIGGVRTTADIHRELLSAFWRNELELFISTNNNPFDRRRLLKSLRGQREHPGFTVVDSAYLVPEKTVEHPDGGVTINLRTYIVLPPDEADWAEDITEKIYCTLASMSFEDFDDRLKTILWALRTSKDALVDYCRFRGYDLPRFWFGKKRPARWTSRDERNLDAWLKQMVTGPKQKSKLAYLADARAKFPGIPQKSFNRIWDKVVPPEWKRSGPARSLSSRARLLTN